MAQKKRVRRIDEVRERLYKSFAHYYDQETGIEALHLEEQPFITYQFTGAKHVIKVMISEIDVLRGTLRLLNVNTFEEDLYLEYEFETDEKEKLLLMFTIPDTRKGNIVLQIEDLKVRTQYSIDNRKRAFALKMRHLAGAFVDFDDFSNDLSVNDSTTWYEDCVLDNYPFKEEFGQLTGQVHDWFLKAHEEFVKKHERDQMDKKIIRNSRRA